MLVKKISTKKLTLETGERLPLMESFYTIQGEGCHCGKAAYFIRLGGCDVGCHWCDTKDSWDVTQYPLVDVDEIAGKAQQQCVESLHIETWHASSLNATLHIAVITGGEPLMYNLQPLCNVLHQKGFTTHLETSGAYPLTGNWGWICFSPKKFKEPLPEIYPRADELKVIIYNQSDFDWAECFAKKVNEKCKLFLQPEWSRSDIMLPVIIDYVKLNPKWKISLQLHKFMNIS